MLWMCLCIFALVIWHDKVTIFYAPYYSIFCGVSDPATFFHII